MICFLRRKKSQILFYIPHVCEGRHSSCLWGKTLVKLPWQWTVWLWRSVMARPLVGRELVGCLTESTNVHQRCFLSESEHAQEHWEGWDLKVVGLHSKRASLTNISFIFVPQHTGVSGNECAYRLGEMAALRIRWAVDSANIMNPLKEMGQVNEYLICMILQYWTDLNISSEEGCDLMGAMHMARGVTGENQISLVCPGQINQ